VLRQGVGVPSSPAPREPSWRLLVPAPSALRLSRRSLPFLVCSRAAILSASSFSIHLRYPPHCTLLSATIPLDSTHTFVIFYRLAYYDPSSCLTLNPKFAPCQSLSRSSLPIRQRLSANPVLPRPQTRLLRPVRSRRSRPKLMSTDKQTVTVSPLQRRHPRGSH